jgi:hypothetical protein
MKSKVILQTIAKKKSNILFSSKREIILFSDGSFAYKRKNDLQKIKLHIKIQEMVKISRNGAVLTLITDIREDSQLLKEKKISNTLVFKFSSSDEALNWEMNMISI